MYTICSTSFVYWQELFLETIFGIYSQNTILPFFRYCTDFSKLNLENLTGYICMNGNILEMCKTRVSHVFLEGIICR